MRREEDVTGPALRELRKQMGQSQEKFWGEVRVKGATGASYEAGRNPIPDIVRRVCYMHFVCGLNINMQEPERAARLLAQADRIKGIASELKEAAKMLEKSSLNN